MIILSVFVLWLYSCSTQSYKLVEVLESNRFRINAKNSITIRLIDDKFLKNLKYIDYITISWFTFDFLVRFVVSPSKLSFMKKFDNIVDFISTFFAYIDFMFINCSLKKLEVIRVMRLMRLFNVSPGMKIIIASIKASAHILQLIFIIMLILSTIFGSFIYYFEKLTSYDGNSQFLSIFDGLWFTVIILFIFPFIFILAINLRF